MRWRLHHPAPPVPWCRPAGVTLPSGAGGLLRKFPAGVICTCTCIDVRGGAQGALVAWVHGTGTVGAAGSEANSGLKPANNFYSQKQILGFCVAKTFIQK